MPSFWPFKRKATKDGERERERTAPSGKAQAQASRAAAPGPMQMQPSPAVQRHSSKRRRASQQEKMHEAQSVKSPRRQGSAVGKENVTDFNQHASKEDITALPVSRRLDSSPHLRPIDPEPPRIPYNFRQPSQSTTSLQHSAAALSRPQTIRSKRSTYSGAPGRRRSSKKRKDDTLREEEIRAMSAAIPIPKRPGEGPLRRDSKKRRGMRDSNVSLPPEGSIHSTMSGIMDQRGWEVGSLDIFNPRPAVRLSGTPQYAGSSSLPGQSNFSRPSSSRPKDRDKTPIKNDLVRKRQTIGEEADEFDASDIRMLMERDAKRRERRKKEQQEKLDRKLRSRGGRNRGDSDRRRREAEEAKNLEDARKEAEETPRARDIVTPPQDVHPAFRNEGSNSSVPAVGLGIDAATAGAATSDVEHQPAHVQPTTGDRGTHNTGTYLDYKQPQQASENPFQDPSQPPTPAEYEGGTPRVPGAFSPVMTPVTPLEDPMARAAPLSQTQTPPLSPVSTNQTDTRASGLAPSVRTQRPVSDLPPPPPIPISERRVSEPKDKRAGGWAGLFRGSGTTRRREEGPTTPSEFSFSNASRESMRHQPLPAHLVDTQASAPRSKSTGGAPMRAKSKFREDLPELPISPPDSRMPSPDVTSAATAAAAARRAKKPAKPADPVERIRDSDTEPSIGRNDTPVSPSQRQGLVSASLASVDSEGSWLASSGNRHSVQSALSRSMGSLRQRRPDFNASYEELGGDRDAEHFKRKTPSPTRAGADNESVSDYGDATPAAAALQASQGGDPLTVHDSIRRKPTLVHRDNRVKSRKGLLAEYAGAEGQSAEIVGSPEDEKDAVDLSGADDPQQEASQVHRARSVNYGKGKSHARQMSAGSAKLLDIKRPSMEAGSGREGTQSSGAPPTPKSGQL